MTFSVLLIKNDQPRVVGTLFANDQTNAEALAPAICGCSQGESIRVCRTEDREIPLRISSVGPVHFY
jgi:predicted transcriptional regulator